MAVKVVGSKRRKRKPISGFHIVYRIFYDGKVVYVGRSTMDMAKILSRHFSGSKGYVPIDILRVSKIDYQEHLSNADAIVYQAYYINLYKPAMNGHNKSRDALTIHLMETGWTEYNGYLWDRWTRDAIKRKEKEHERYLERRKEIIKTVRVDEEEE